MKTTNGDEINTFRACDCNSTGGCEKCRPKYINNYYKTYILSEFEKYNEK